MKSTQELIEAIKRKSDAKFPIIYEVFSSRFRKRLKDGCNTADKVIENQNIDSKFYEEIKQYLLKRSEKLEIENALVHFDDDAQRIDIGYDAQNLECLFPELYARLSDAKYISRAERKYMEQCFTERHREQIKSEEERLFAQAKIKLVSQAVAKRSPVSLSIFKTDANIIKACLKEHNGIAIGEAHKHRSSKLFLINNFELLKSEGVTTLYMEHLLDSHQELLDQYNSSPTRSPMPKLLAAYLEMLDSDFLNIEQSHTESGTFTNLVVQAKKAGIRIIAIDTDITYNQGVASHISDLYNEEERTQKRCKALHMHSLEIFEKFKDGNKFVFFVGNAHVAECYGVPGISELWGIPNIVVCDTKNDYDLETCEQNASYLHLKFDILLERSPKGPKKDCLMSLILCAATCFTLGLGALYMLRSNTAYPKDTTYTVAILMPAILLGTAIGYAREHKTVLSSSRGAEAT